MTIYLYLTCGCFHAVTAELSSCDKDCMAFEAENIYCRALVANVCQPLICRIKCKYLTRAFQLPGDVIPPYFSNLESCSPY